MPRKLKLTFILLGLSLVGTVIAESYFAAAIWTLLLILLWKGKEGARSIILLCSWIGFVVGIGSLGVSIAALLALGALRELDLITVLLVLASVLQTATAWITIWSLQSLEVKMWLFNKSVGGLATDNE